MTSKINQFAQGFRLFTGEAINQLVDAVNNITGNGTANPVSASTLTTTGNVSQALATSSFTSGFQTVTAAGTTQLNATALTGSKAIITVATTASTHGVRLPTAVTGLEVFIANAAAFGAKIWPATGDRIGAAATNAVGPVLAINKATRFVALDAVRWIAQTGA